MTLRTCVTIIQACTFVVLAVILLNEGGNMNLRLAFAQALLALITVAVYV